MVVVIHSCIPGGFRWLKLLRRKFGLWWSVGWCCGWEGDLWPVWLWQWQPPPRRPAQSSISWMQQRDPEIANFHQLSTADLCLQCRAPNCKAYMQVQHWKIELHILSCLCFCLLQTYCHCDSVLHSEGVGGFLFTSLFKLQLFTSNNLEEKLFYITS